MKIEDFLKYSWADGQIINIDFEKDNLKLTIQDWEENNFNIEFFKVFELYLKNYFNEDISHLEYYKNDQGIETVKFISAWDENEIVRFSFQK